MVFAGTRRALVAAFVLLAIFSLYLTAATAGCSTGIPPPAPGSASEATGASGGVPGGASPDDVVQAGDQDGADGAHDTTRTDAILAQAFADRAAGLQVKGQGTVIRLLADDTEGSRHQRFIVRLASGQTLLISHNIDVAPRVSALEVNDAVAFKGVYEWNEQGGIIHWTHGDPAGRHVPGWIEHGGRIYQ